MNPNFNPLELGFTKEPIKNNSGILESRYRKQVTEDLYYIISYYHESKKWLGVKVVRYNEELFTEDMFNYITLDQDFARNMFERMGIINE